MCHCPVTVRVLSDGTKLPTAFSGPTDAWVTVWLFQEMALCKEVKSLQMVPSYLVQPLKANASAHLALSQVTLLSRLLRDLGTDSTGFTVENVMTVSVGASVGGGSMPCDTSGTDLRKAAKWVVTNDMHECSKPGFRMTHSGMCTAR